MLKTRQRTAKKAFVNSAMTSLLNRLFDTQVSNIASSFISSSFSLLKS